MRRLRGVGVSGGSRVGRSVHLEAVEFAAGPSAIRAEDVPRELERLARAVQVAVRGLEESQRALALDPRVGSIFEVHRILLDAVRGEIEEAVRSGSSAEHATATVLSRYASRLASIADPMFAERRQDVLDIERRLLRALSGSSASSQDRPTAGEVLVALDLTPSEAAALAGGRVGGLVLEHGGATSHTAIIAKALSIPCVVGVAGALAGIPPGVDVWVDGGAGSVVVEPDEKSLEAARERARAHEASERTLLAESHLPTETLDGHAAVLLGNIEFPLEVKAAVDRGAAGVGLYRTEFLFDPAHPVPDEAEHVAAYREALAHTGRGRLTIRTFDFGSDKATPGAASEEANPALGLRSLRWCFGHPDVFRPQLRALLRVATEGDVRIMLPMVGAPEDSRRVRAMLAECARELARDGVPHDPSVRVGAMIEIPAAAATADLLAREVDFFSIGTNDLTQYTLAMDRGHPRLARQADALHPAVLRMMAMTVEGAHEQGKWVGVCGGLASDALAVPLLVGLGLDELSVSVPSIAPVKAAIGRHRLSECSELATEVLRCRTTAEVRQALVQFDEAGAPAKVLT